MSDSLLNFAGSQTADVHADAAGRDAVRAGGNVYSGVPSEAVMGMWERHMDKEPQRQSLMVSAIEQGFAKASDAVAEAEGRTAAQLDRVSAALERLASLTTWLASAMLAQAIFSALALFLGLWALLRLIGPQLVAGL